MTNAERLLRALYKLTEGQPGHWRMITSLGRVGTAGAGLLSFRVGAAIISHRDRAVGSIPTA